MLEEFVSISPGSPFSIPHPSQIIPWMMQLLQNFKCIPPNNLQFTVGLLCPIMVTFSISDTLISEDNVTSVVMLIRTLLVRLASALSRELQEHTGNR